MGRLVNGVRTIENPRPRHIGKLLVFCEGSTEYNYFSYLNNYFRIPCFYIMSQVIIQIAKVIVLC